MALKQEIAAGEHDSQKRAGADGQYRRVESLFRQKTISPVNAVKGRYILYCHLGCPWAGRTLIVRSLKKLEDYIDLSLTDVVMSPDGWFWSGQNGSDPKDPINGYTYLRDVYKSVDPGFNRRFTVPVLYDTVEKTIVNNESGDIIRILNDFPRQNQQGKDKISDDDDIPDLYPEHLRREIDAINEKTYEPINNGVYKCGFASTQAAYTEHVTILFKALQEMNLHLSGVPCIEVAGAGPGSAGVPRDYLCGKGKGELTEADVRLFMTLARFDCAYHNIFRCNLRRIKDYPHLHRYFVALYKIPEFKKWTDFELMKRGYAGIVKRVGDKETVVPIGPLEADIL